MASKTNRKRTTRKLIVAVVGLVILAACVGLATLAQGKVRGQEFSPDDFRQREFRLWEVPLVHLQITPIRRSGAANPLTTYLTAQRLIQVPPASNNSQRWHLVQLSRGSLPRPPADAEILVNYLNQDGGSRWRQWSVAHPNMAKVFWPKIQQLAQREMYVLMPDLFAIAEQANSSVQLTERMDRYLRDSYFQIASDLRDAGKPTIAAEVLQEAVSDFPDDQELQKLLDEVSQIPAPA